MKQTVDRLQLANMLESEDTRDKLAQAGYRGQAPLIAFIFFRFVMPFVVFAAGAVLSVRRHAFRTGGDDEVLRRVRRARCSASICPTSSSRT